MTKRENDLWCVELPINPAEPDGRRTTLPARDRAHAESLAASLGGTPQQWTRSPDLHQVLVYAFDRVLGEPKALDTDRWLASHDRAANRDPS